MTVSRPGAQTEQRAIPSVVRSDERLEALRQYRILDTEPEPAFDRIAKMAGHLFDAPTAIINFIDAERQWFKATRGFEEKQTGLDVSFCVYTLDAGEVTVIEDLSADERFETNPFVTEDGVRFYAGAPLVTSDGHRLGTLCVLDTDPQSPSEDTLNRLSDLAAMVVDELELRREIDERRKIESHLRRREDRLQVAQYIADLGYWTRDLRTDELVWSDETRRIFGWDEEKEVTYEAFMEAVHPDDRERLQTAQKAVLAGEGGIDLEYRIRRPSGEERVLQERGGLRHNEEGEPVLFMGAVLDVTERVRRREQLREAKEAAEEADRVKSALLSNMNHELRTPLTSIISFAELVDEKPEVASRFTDRILGGGRRLLYTLNTVMEFAELEAGNRSINPQDFQVGAVVRSVVNEFRERSRGDEVDLRVEVPEAMGSVTLDEYAVERILVHLVHNATKFTEDGTVTVSGQVEPDAVTLCVSDTGKGIDPASLPEVFDEFTQASTGYDRTHEGNGLGLTVVQRLVDEVGGTVDLESTPGEGTDVTVCLPLK